MFGIGPTSFLPICALLFSAFHSSAYIATKFYVIKFFSDCVSTVPLPHSCQLLFSLSPQYPTGIFNSVFIILLDWITHSVIHNTVSQKINSNATAVCLPKINKIGLCSSKSQQDEAVIFQTLHTCSLHLQCAVGCNSH